MTLCVSLCVHTYVSLVHHNRDTQPYYAHIYVTHTKSCRTYVYVTHTKSCHTYMYVTHTQSCHVDPVTHTQSCHVDPQRSEERSFNKIPKWYVNHTHISHTPNKFIIVSKHTFTYTYTNTCTHTYTHTPIHAEHNCISHTRKKFRNASKPHIHIYIYKYMHTHIHTCTYTCCTQMHARSACAQMSDTSRYVRGRGGGLGSRPKKMYGKRLGDGVEYHLMIPTPRC